MVHLSFICGSPSIDDSRTIFHRRKITGKGDFACAVGVDNDEGFREICISRSILHASIFHAVEA